MALPPRLLPIRIVAAALAILIPAAGADEAPSAPDISGSWTWSWKDDQGETHRHVLQVEGKPPKLAARERFDDQPPVKVEDLKLDGDKVEFTVRRDDRTAQYRGKVVDKDTINGQVTVMTDGQPQPFGWTATRVREEP